MNSWASATVGLVCAVAVMSRKKMARIKLRRPTSFMKPPGKQVIMTDEKENCQRGVACHFRAGIVLYNAELERGPWRGKQFVDRLFHFRRNRIHIVQRQAGGRNWFTKTHLQRLALDVIRVHRQQVESPDQH